MKKNKHTKPKSIWIATGGTGGHIFPALAVSDELIAHGYRITVSSDGRGMKYVKDHIKKAQFSSLIFRSSFVWAGGVGAKKHLFQIWSLFKIAISAVALFFRFAFSRPCKIVAFGGYSSVPILMAGWVWRIPTFLHEQNAAMGRANRFALPFVKTLMTSFDVKESLIVNKKSKVKIIHTGLPVRKEFHRNTTHDSRFTARESRLLITGGSLGAKALDDVVPLAIKEMKNRKKIFVTHQTRPENVEKLRKTYVKMGVKNNVLSFIKDFADEISRSCLVIGRAGASTVAELQTTGTPAVLIPLWINPDQLANAKAFSMNGGGIVIEQKNLSVDVLVKTLTNLFDNPKKLSDMSKKAYVPNNAVDKIIEVVLS